MHHRWADARYASQSQGQQVQLQCNKQGNWSLREGVDLFNLQLCGEAGVEPSYFDVSHLGRTKLGQDAKDCLKCTFSLGRPLGPLFAATYLTCLIMLAGRGKAICPAETA